MQPFDKPQDHELYHERQYPPYSPPLPSGRRGDGVWACALLLALSVLGLWGLSRGDDTRRHAQIAAFEAGPAYGNPGSVPLAKELQPSESLLTADLEPAESGLRPAPVGEPLEPSPEEQALSRDLAELASQMSRTQRLADRLGQHDAYRPLLEQHAALQEAVAERTIPWNEKDRVELEHQTQTLRARVAKFSNELEEIAAVQL